MNRYKTILKILITLPGRNIYNIPPDRIIEIDGNDIYVFGKNGNSFFTLESMDWLTDCLDGGKIIKLEGNYGKESYI